MRLLIICFLLQLSAFSFAKEKQQQYFMLAGASFAIPENSWFEMGCEAFDARSINKAVSGEAITHTAVAMFNDRFYTLEELDKTDVFVIMHVHNQAVADDSSLKEDFRDYTEVELTSNYTAAYDYVIRRYKSDCYELKDNPSSKYYNTENGKSAVIVLCTHWHDARTIFNADVRKLAQKWNLHLVKFDDNIGFTKDVLEDGKQPSLQYASDTKTYDGQTYGFHPLRGRNQYIQQKMTSIFVAEMETLLGKIPPTAILREKSMSVVSGQDAYVSFYFFGESPWNLTYSVNGQTITKQNITENPLLVKVDTDADGVAKVLPISVSNESGLQGEVYGESLIKQAGKVLIPVYDSYIHQKSNTTVYETGNQVQLKGLFGNYSREAFFSFRLDEVQTSDERVVFRAYLYNNIYSGEQLKENQIVEISGNSETYTGLTWNSKPEDMEIISESVISPADLNSYVSWDVTKWVKEQKTSGKEIVTLRLRIVDYTIGLLYFYSSEYKSNKPQLLITPANILGIGNDNTTEQLKSYYNPSDKKIYIESETSIGNLSLFTSEGKCYYYSANVKENSYSLDVSALPKGLYLLLAQNENYRNVQKILKPN